MGQEEWWHVRRSKKASHKSTGIVQARINLRGSKNYREAGWAYRWQGIGLQLGWFVGEVGPDAVIVVANLFNHPLHRLRSVLPIVLTTAHNEAPSTMVAREVER